MGGGSGPGIFVQERNNVIIRNIRIINFHTGITFTWKSFDSSKTLRSNKVHSNTIVNNTYGIVFGDSSEGNEVSGNFVSGNAFGVSISGSSNNVFRNNRFDDNQYAVIDDSSYPNDIDTSNTINGKPIYYWVNQHGKTVPFDAGWAVLKNCSGITVQNLNLEGNWHGILLYYTNDSTISGNVVTNNFEGITLKESSNNAILDSRVTNNNESGITLEYGCANNVISGNRVESNGWGIGVGDDSNNNVVSKNEVAANVKHGVSFGYHSIGNAAIENHVAKNGGSGIFFSTIQDSNVTGNNVTLNKGCGIGFGYGPNGLVRQNYISKNSVGIWISNAEANTITFNSVAENAVWGIELEGSHKNNMIHHNNFINNAADQGIQARIAEIWIYPGLNKPHRPGETVEPPRLVGGAANVWDNGKEGNYWSDYTARYPNASMQGDSGTADTPYFINENNMDRYPLLNPVDASEVPDGPAVEPSPTGHPPKNLTSPEQQTENYTEEEFQVEYAIAAIVLGVGIAAVSAYQFLKRRKTPSNSSGVFEDG
jgi:parallel beta-helix repeat protein